MTKLNHPRPARSATGKYIFGKTHEPISVELGRLQGQTGLTVTWIRNYAINFIVFARRAVSTLSLTTLPSGTQLIAISPDGTQIAVAVARHMGIELRDGANFREYPDLNTPLDICWSYDNSKLAMQVKNMKQHAYGNPSLQLVDTGSGDPKEIDTKGIVSSQCWSPDSKQFVYQSAGGVWIYDTGQRKARTLTPGYNPTWSPDGQWIAFLDSDAYFAIRPNGEDRKLLFKRKHAASGLLWSPDSRFVAFSSQAGLLHQLPVVDVEVYLLRIRRLEDGSEYSIDENISGSQFQWTRNPEFEKSQ